MKEERANEIDLDSDGGVTHGSDNEPGQQSGSTGLADNKATGPRTKQGKQTSSRNATKHGVFSKVIILEGEPRDEYEAVLEGLWEALQPEGTLEELLVEKLATLVWRQRRLLMAEGETIARSSDSWNNYGLIRSIHNPDVLERCLQLLAELRKQVGRDGFNLLCDKRILKRIYGGCEENRLSGDLVDYYELCLKISQISEEERERNGLSSREECRLNMLKEIDEETGRLMCYKKAHTSIGTVRTQLETLRHSIPDASGLDRPLRYEASLERSFDRTLSQLERLQRMRRGQPVLAQLVPSRSSNSR
jgi:hypothetical protein